MIEEEASPEQVEEQENDKPSAKFLLINLLKWIGGFMLLVLLGYFFLYLSERFFS